MLKNPLFRQLIFTLVALTVAAVLINFVWNADGFFINLATTLIGSLVTILFVDRILEANEKRRWAPVQALLSNKLERVGNTSIAILRDAYGLDASAIEWEDSENVPARRRKTANVAMKILLPMTMRTFHSLSPETWRSMCRHYQGVVSDIVLVLQIVGPKLEAQTLATLLELEGSIDSLLAKYSLLPDVFGVPNDKLKPLTNGRSAVSLKRTFTELAARDAESILRSASALLEQIASHNSAHNNT